MFNDYHSTCGNCHSEEELDPSVTGVHGFVSKAFRTVPADQVPSAELMHELEICDRDREPNRCALLDGLLGWGAVNDRQFPPEMAIFGQ